MHKRDRFVVISSGIRFYQTPELNAIERLSKPHPPYQAAVVSPGFRVAYHRSRFLVFSDECWEQYIYQETSSYGCLSVLFYGMEIWADAFGKEVYRKRLTQVQGPDVIVIVEVISVVLLAKERRAIYMHKGEDSKEMVAHEERQIFLGKRVKLQINCSTIRKLRSVVEPKIWEDYFFSQFRSGLGSFHSHAILGGRDPLNVCLE